MRFVHECVRPLFTPKRLEIGPAIETRALLNEFHEYKLFRWLLTIARKIQSIRTGEKGKRQINEHSGMSA